MLRFLCLILLTLMQLAAPSWAVDEPLEDNAPALHQTLVLLKENSASQQDLSAYKTCLTTMWQCTEKWLGGTWDGKDTMSFMNRGMRAIYNALNQLTIQQQETLLNNLSPLYKEQIKNSRLMLRPANFVEDLAQHDHSLIIGTWFKDIATLHINLTPALLSYIVPRLNQITSLQLHVIPDTNNPETFQKAYQDLMSYVAWSTSLTFFRLGEDSAPLSPKTFKVFLWSLQANLNSVLGTFELPAAGEYDVNSRMFHETETLRSTLRQKQTALGITPTLPLLTITQGNTSVTL